MAYDPVNVGAAGNDHTGDPLRTAFGKLNTMLAEVYALLGVGITAVAVAALSDGDMVHVYDDAGVMKMELADAADTTKPADGFVRGAVAMGAPAIVYPRGAVNTAVAGLAPGKRYYLASGGGLTDVIPAVAGNAIQEVGFAIDAAALFFDPQPANEVPGL